MIIEIKDRRTVFLFCLLTPLAIMIPNVLAELSSDGIGFTIRAESIALILFASLVLGFLYFIIEHSLSQPFGKVEGAEAHALLIGRVKTNLTVWKGTMGNCSLSHNSWFMVSQ
jgi:hypothetical protein